jgi:hypothetical protein
MTSEGQRSSGSREAAPRLGFLFSLLLVALPLSLLTLAGVVVGMMKLR